MLVGGGEPRPASRLACSRTCKEIEKLEKTEDMVDSASRTRRA